jgi:F-type H+-transporting ATPase subunit b
MASPDDVSAEAAEVLPVTAGAETAGMPQLDFSTFPNQIFWLVTALVSIYFLLTRVALPRMGAVMAERSGTITNDLAAAEDLKARAQEAEAAYEASLKEARSEANRIVAQARAEMQAELDEAIAEADERIAERTAESERAIAGIREQASESVREVAREAAREIVQAMGFEPEGGRVDAAVDQRVGGSA